MSATFRAPIELLDPFLGAPDETWEILRNDW
jgi:hypothetical protein